MVQNEITHVINPTKKITDLQKQLDFADTFQNRINLANALFEIKDYHNALGAYENVLDADRNGDAGVIKKIIESYSQINNSEKVIFYAEKIKENSDFRGSRSQFLYGLALEEQGESDRAEGQLRGIDQRYSHYRERFVLAEFLVKKGKVEEAKEILHSIQNEAQHMSKPNKNLYKSVVQDVNTLASSL
ncbi:CDC27 family protein [Aquimarina pacifica]|uniref:CDC27 family protein n=1 Tax=Aquimarina pacifica TaxID=1296415 RepID=UPI0004AD7DAD|nr:CDC27 family protein [Aquimarina pacifica]